MKNTYKKPRVRVLALDGACLMDVASYSGPLGVQQHTSNETTGQDVWQNIDNTSYNLWEEKAVRK